MIKLIIGMIVGMAIALVAFNGPKGAIEKMNNHEHLTSQEITYFEHLGGAWSYGFKFIAVGVGELVHGVFPQFFTYDILRFIKFHYEDRELDKREDL